MVHQSIIRKLISSITNKVQPRASRIKLGYLNPFPFSRAGSRSLYGELVTILVQFFKKFISLMKDLFQPNWSLRSLFFLYSLLLIWDQILKALNKLFKTLTWLLKIFKNSSCNFSRSFFWNTVRNFSIELSRNTFKDFSVNSSEKFSCVLPERAWKNFFRIRFMKSKKMFVRARIYSMDLTMLLLLHCFDFCLLRPICFSNRLSYIKSRNNYQFIICHELWKNDKQINNFRICKIILFFNIIIS